MPVTDHGIGVGIVDFLGFVKAAGLPLFAAALKGSASNAVIRTRNTLFITIYV